MAMSIRDPRASELAREVARETGETLTQAVVVALEERLERLKGRRTAGTALEDIMSISRHCSALPEQDPRAPEEILGYGKDGAPDHGD